MSSATAHPAATPGINDLQGSQVSHVSSARVTRSADLWGVMAHLECDEASSVLASELVLGMGTREMVDDEVVADSETLLRAWLELEMALDKVDVGEVADDDLVGCESVIEVPVVAGRRQRKRCH